MSASTKHFVFFIPMTMMFYGMIYGAGTGAVALVVALIFAPPEAPTMLGNIILVILCSPFAAFFGALAGMYAGIILGLIDSLFVSLVTLNFWQREILWQKRQEFRAIILLISFGLNILVMLVVFPSHSSTPLIIKISFTTIATTLVINHFDRWHYNYLIKYPDILYQSELATFYSELATFYIVEGYDRLTYKMPEIPDNLHRYADGELPAELLRQFPIDKV